MDIRVAYTTIDGFRQARTFKTLKGAQKFAHNWIGPHPDLGMLYAIADDGVGKITVYGGGVTIKDIFPERID